MGRVGQGLTPLSPLRTARADFSASGSSTLNAYGQRTKYCKLLDFTIITIRDIPALYISSQPNLIGVFTCMRCTTLLGLDCWSTLTFLLLFSFNAYYRFLVPEHLHRKSAQLSLEVMLIISVLYQKKSQLLSASLQNGIRFFLHPLPAPPSLGIASFLLPRKKGRTIRAYQVSSEIRCRWLSTCLYSEGIITCVPWVFEPDSFTLCRFWLQRLSSPYNGDRRLVFFAAPC